MQKNNKTNFICFIILIIILSLFAFVYSCEKKEPAVQPEPDEIMKKITDAIKDLPGGKSIELSETNANELYASDKNKPADLSKIEKSSVIKATGSSAEEIGIFKLYDKNNTEYVKQMAQTRISKMQESNIKTFNDAEIRSYGNYVYYASHPQKDKIFKIIEDTLRGA